MITPTRSPTAKWSAVRGVGVHRDLMRADRPGSGDELERVEALVSAEIDAEAEPRRTAVRDDLAVPADELHLGLDATRRRGDAGEPLDAGQRRLREGGRVRRAAENGLSGHDRVGVRVGDGEDRVESGVDRVGEDVGAAHHRDAHHDRERGQQEPELPAEQILDRDPDHAGASVSSSFIVFRISASLSPRRSSTILPSSR